MKKYLNPSVESLLTPPYGSTFHAIVISDSMYPTIVAGDDIEIIKVSMETLRPNDIILYADVDNAHPIVHRIIRIDGNKNNRILITKGDYVPWKDAQKITKRSYIGKVVKIRKTLRGFVHKFLLTIGM